MGVATPVDYLTNDVKLENTYKRRERGGFKTKITY
jgi:hypothetical protein